jgi:hypothetical protein
MSLGKRVLRPIKAVIAVPSSKGIEVIDPAIDLENSDIEAYWESLFDIRHITFFPGEQPTWVTMSQMSRKQKDAVDVALGERQAASWYIRCAVVDIENYTIIDNNGETIEAPKPDRKNRGRAGEMASEEWLDRMNFPDEHRTALFLMIHHISEAKLPLSMRSEPRPGHTST